MIKSSQPLNIAIFGARFLSWNGGIDFLRHQLNGLICISRTTPIKLLLVFPNNKKLNFFSRVVLRIKLLIKIILKKNPDSVIRKLKNDFLSNESVAEMFNYPDGQVKIIFTSHNPKKINKKLIKYHADVTLFADHKFITKIPNITYYPDLQHKYLTDFFTKEEIESRDKVIRDLLLNSKVMAVNSMDVKNDLSKFFCSEIKNCQIFNLPYSPMLMQPGWLDDLPTDIEEKYQLPKRYFLISNQLWIHKSHITAFAALAKLVKNPDFSDLKIICTGPTTDYRFPEYFSELKAKIKEMAMDDKVVFLGLIPKREQIEIMKKSVAIIQPTLFEGDPGGGSFYDAVSLGVPAIISDIKVNLEASGELNSFFFKTKDADDLKEKMEQVLKETPIRLNKEELILKSQERSERLGRRWLELIAAAIDRS